MNNRDLQNQEQFLRLLMLNDKSIYAYILFLVHNASDADDIWQEASAVMWRKFSDFSNVRAIRVCQKVMSISVRIFEKPYIYGILGKPGHGMDLTLPG